MKETVDDFIRSRHANYSAVKYFGEKLKRGKNCRCSFPYIMRGYGSFSEKHKRKLIYESSHDVSWLLFALWHILRIFVGQARCCPIQKEPRLEIPGTEQRGYPRSHRNARTGKRSCPWREKGSQTGIHIRTDNLRAGGRGWEQPPIAGAAQEEPGWKNL